MKCQNCEQEIKDEFMSKIIIGKIKLIVCDDCKAKLGDKNEN